MKAFLGIILTLIIAVIGVGGYIGFIPGVASVFGSDKPRDLGVKVTKEDSDKAQAMTGVILADLPSDTPISQSIKFEGKKEVKVSFDDISGSAIMNNRPWKYYPFYNVQVKIHPDGTIESSGMINMDKVFQYTESLGFATADVEKAMNDYKIPKMNMPYYIKGKGEVINNKVTLNVDAVQAGRLSIPSSIISQNQSRAAQVVETAINKLEGFYAKSLKVENGKVVFDGTMAEKEFVVTK